MKGTVNSGNYGAKTGGEIDFAHDSTKINARNLRRMMKKYPNDPKLQELLKQELIKYEIK